MRKFLTNVQELLDYLSPPDKDCHFCYHQQKVIDGKAKGFPSTEAMLVWSKKWLKDCPLMGDDTKRVLTDFCQEWED